MSVLRNQDRLKTRATTGLWVAIAFGLVVSPLFADALVAPHESENLQGQGNQAHFAGGRYLNVYNNTHFLSAMPQGAIINGIAFRVDESQRSLLGSVQPQIEIRLSTTPSMQPFIPLEFARSVGTDEKIVFPRGTIQFSTSPNASGPNPFDVMIPFQQSFAYDPRSGGLTVDIRVYERASPPFRLDTEFYDQRSVEGSIGSSLASASGGALVMRISFEAIPEPTPLLILTAGVVCLVMGIKRMR